MTTPGKTSGKNKELIINGDQAQGLQMQLAEKMMGIFDVVISDRRKYYKENPDKIPTPSTIPFIIQKYATMNMAASGGISLIPGPWGMAAAIPEIAILIRNQFALIYDIGVAYGKSKVINKELLAGIFLSAMGVSVSGLLVMHGGKVFVRRVALRVFQRIIMLLAGKVTQQMLKSLVSKWLPIVGAAAMAAWANYSTRKIGKKAAEIMAMPIEVIEEESNDVNIVEAVTTIQPQMKVEAAPNYITLKIMALINLMKVDRKINPEESSFIQTLIENSELDDVTKIELSNLVGAETRAQVDFAVFSKDPDEVIGMLIDLISLAKRDGEFHPTEKIYIKQAGKLMGLSESDIKEVMSLEQPEVKVVA